jgi:hypothetical protein
MPITSQSLAAPRHSTRRRGRARCLESSRWKALVNEVNRVRMLLKHDARRGRRPASSSEVPRPE